MPATLALPPNSITYYITMAGFCKLLDPKNVRIAFWEMAADGPTLTETGGGCMGQNIDKLLEVLGMTNWQMEAVGRVVGASLLWIMQKVGNTPEATL